ncbi:MAG: hypothetical protein MOB07_29505 [Acidobacteria bacterium]|nr:hypothetical protein [Acidobacteriota bacterium]
MNHQSDQLIGIISAVRKRRNLLTVLRGLAITIAITAAMLVIAALAAYRFRFSAAALVSLRIFAVLCVIAAVYLALVRPLRRLASDAQLARLVEEKHAGIEDRFVTALEFSSEEQRAAFSPVIVDRLVDDADRHARDVSVDEIVPRKRFWQFGAAAAASLALFIAALIFGPKEIKIGLASIITPNSPVVAATALKLEVKPGTARVPKGSDQKIIAKLLNFTAEKATVFARKAGASDDQWIGQMMEPAKNNNEFQHFIFNIQDDTEYWVESNSCKSEVFKLTVADLPYVKRIDQTQNFPAFTGLAPKTIEDAPNVSVLAGTTVKLLAKLTGKAKSARIVLRDGGKIEMEKTGETDFAATLTVNKDNSYHIEVTSVEGDVYNGSNEYDITLLEDRPPTVTFEKPGRDARATSVEEVFTQAKAEDDYGVLSLDLYFAVNGGEEKKVDLQKLKGESAREMMGAHTFFLEEFGLQPGDLISYYAKARDAHKETTSDIYFIEVKPFEKEFKQSQQGGQQGGEGERQEGLTKRQKEIIAATFRVNRDEAIYSEKEKEDNYNTISLAQEKVREDAIGLVERIKRRMGEGLGQNQDFVKLVEHVTQASKEMEPAIKELKARKGKDAMQPEQRALKELQRADTIFREIQVTMSQSSQGQSSQQAEELADLFELEMDKRKNQYETLNRERQQQSQQQDDEAKRKMEELARRMQREMEQQQQRMRQQARNQGGGGGGRQQQQMIDEARKAARELERLSRERRDPQMQDLANKLNQAAEEMQRAQNASQNNKEAEALASTARALQQLEDARRRLDQMRKSQGGASLQDLKQRAAQAAQRQNEITKDVDDLSRRSRSGDPSVNESKRQVAERKDALANEVGNLEKDIDQAARGMNQEQQGAASKLREAATGLRQNRVQDRIRYTKQWMESNQFDATRQHDQIIQQNLDQLAQQLSEAEKNAQRKGAGGETEDSLERTRKLADNLESMRKQLSNQGQRGDPQQQGDQANRNQQQGGNQQQQNQNQPGQGRQNQPGRQGNDQQIAQNQNGQRGQDGRQQNQNRGQQGRRQDGRQQGNQQGEQQQGGQQQGGQQQGGQQQGGQEQAGSGPSRGGQQPPNSQSSQFPTGGGPIRGYDRQLGSEMRERLREAEDIRRNLGRDRDLASSLDQAIQGLRRANDAIMRDDMQTALLLKDQVIEPLRNIELELSKRLQMKLGKNNLRLSDEGEAPAAYRKLVDEYYKRLSAQSPKP